MARIVSLALLLLLTALPGIASAQTVRDIAARGACSTAGVEGISAQLAEAQMCIRPGAFVRFAPHPGITLSSSRIHPYAQATTRDALHRAASRVSITVNSAFRTLADQYVLYHSGGCGLAAPPGRSNHQSGRAVDVGNYSAAKSALTGQGCSWLGSRDPVHFDCPGSDRRSDSVLAFQKLWNANNPGDRIAEDGLYGPQTESRLGRTPARGFATDLCDSSPDPMPSGGGRLIGVVYEAPDTDARIGGARVRIVETDDTTTVGADGLWRFDVPSGTYTVEASASGFVTARRTCIVEGSEVWCSVGLARGTAEGTVRGVVYEDTGAGVADTSVRLAGATVVVTETGASLTTDETGSFGATLAPGEYTLAVSSDGHASATRTCTVEADAEVWCSVGLSPAGAAGTLEGVVFVGEDMTRRIVGASVEVVETGASVASREGDGYWRFDLPAGTYTVQVTGDGVAAADRTCEVASGDSTYCSVSVELIDPSAVVIEEHDGSDTDHGPAVAGEDPVAAADGEVGRPGGTLRGGCSATGAGVPGTAPLLLLLLPALLLRRRRR